MTVSQSIVILGPTAGGKSELAVGLAEHFQAKGRPAAVVGADSMQVYRKLDAGTAKPDPSQRQRAPHHLIDIVEPTERFTVHDWLGRACGVIEQLHQQHGLPIVVGGTNLYLKALLEGMFEGPGQDQSFRQSLEKVPTEDLHQRLKTIDPITAERVKPADRQRIIRALEVYALTDRPISDWQQQWSEAPGPEPREYANQGGAKENASESATEPLDPSARTLIGLRWPAEAINPRINLRVKAMFYPHKVDEQLAREVCINGESLIDEVKRLRAEGAFEPIAPGVPNQAREALGYKQLLAWIEGTDPKIASLEDAFEKTKVLTRRFAKQQRTWLKRFRGVAWIDCDQHATAQGVLEQALAACGEKP